MSIEKLRNEKKTEEQSEKQSVELSEEIILDLENHDYIHQLVAQKEPNICQLVVYKNGELVLSDSWNGFKESDKCHVMSVTKSVIALLIGICIDKGLIKDVEQNVVDFFPEYQIKRGEKTIRQVQIKHLLTMTAPYKYKSEPWTRVCSSMDWTEAALDLLGGKKGITGEFKYSTLGIHILSGIITRVSGMDTVAFANEYLFKPLEIKEHESYCALTAAEHKEYTLSKEPRQALWQCDPMGVATAGYGLCLSAADMAKIGLIFLNKGEYKGQRIVSSEWLEACISPYYQCGFEFGNMQYGYLWWIIDVEKNIFAAIGDGGNVILVDPEVNTVIAVASTFKPRVFDRVDFIRKKIEPFI